MTSSVLVVPTVREECIKRFLGDWGKQWDAIIVVEDNFSKTFDINVEYHYCWQDIEKELGKNSWIIARRDSAIRSFGYLMAHRMGYDFLYSLDDDCLPTSDCIINHVNNMENMPKYEMVIPNMKTRGLPLFNRGLLSNVNLSVGLWNNIPDLSAIEQIVNPIQDFISPDYTKVLPHGQYFPISGMNLCWKRFITPAMYFQGIFPRYDDIFAGIVLKKIFDHLGFYVACGKPRVKHCKASNPIDNLVKESSSLKTNEVFWEIINNITLTGKNVSECMFEIGNGLEKTMDEKLSLYGKAIKIWVLLFK